MTHRHRLYKGFVDYTAGDDFHMVCVGLYWDWPWWKRALSRMFRYPYREFYREWARFQWRHDKNRLKEIGRDFYLESAFAIADTHIQPILFELVKGPPEGPERVHGHD